MDVGGMVSTLTLIGLSQASKSFHVGCLAPGIVRCPGFFSRGPACCWSCHSNKETMCINNSTEEAKLKSYNPEDEELPYPEFSFWAWDNDTDKMLKPEDGWEIKPEVPSAWYGGIDREGATPLMASGKKDMHGNMIYQGHIVQVNIKENTDHFGAASRFVVSLELDSWGYAFNWNHIEGSGYHCPTHIMRDHDDLGGCNYEIIGHELENPELL